MTVRYWSDWWLGRSGSGPYRRDAILWWLRGGPARDLRTRARHRWWWLRQTPWRLHVAWHAGRAEYWRLSGLFWGSLAAGRAVVADEHPEVRPCEACGIAGGHITTCPKRRAGAPAGPAK